MMAPQERSSGEAAIGICQPTDSVAQVPDNDFALIE